VLLWLSSVWAIPRQDDPGVITATSYITQSAPETVTTTIVTGIFDLTVVGMEMVTGTSGIPAFILQTAKTTITLTPFWTTPTIMLSCTEGKVIVDVNSITVTSETGTTETTTETTTPTTTPTTTTTTEGPSTTSHTTGTSTPTPVLKKGFVEGEMYFNDAYIPVDLPIY
jgi:hypothetical protein